MRLYQSCPLYAIQSKKMLLQVLGTQDKRWQKQSFVQQNISPYIAGTDKKRLIEVPTPQLSKIQKRIKNCLMKCDFPDYVFSGIKGKSYIENAESHQGCKYIFKIDISAFFPNTSRDKVYRFYIEKIKTSPDVALILTNLCTSDLSRKLKHREAIDEFLQDKAIVQTNHLCTGASPSPILSYLVNQAMFDEMKSVCDRNGIDMTIYVDDTIFSCNHPITSNIRNQILHIVKKYGYSVSFKKVKYYSKCDIKKVTGVIIKPDGTLDVPNKLRYKIVRRLEEQKTNPSTNNINRLAGCVVAARQIDTTAYPSIVEYISAQRSSQKRTQTESSS